MNNISLIQQKCIDVVSGGLSRDEFNKFLGSINVLHYIKVNDLFLLTYETHLNAIVSSLEDEEVSRYAYDVLVRSELAYLAAKLKLTFDASVYDGEIFDTFEESGFMDFIVNENPRQYEQYKQLVSKTLDMNAVAVIGELANSLNVNAKDLVELSERKEFKEAVSKLNIK